MRKFLATLLLFLVSAAQAGPLDADFDALERMLRLKPAQKEQFDVAVGSTKRALLAVALSGLEIKDRVSKELAKDRPDLNALYDIHDQVIEQNKPLFRAARDDWSKLYAVLEPDQVALAKKYIEERLGGIIK